ncbi:hypothetical protein [Aurantibacillus circumpalustris]|uniref:hypothetical protein n=1 Tax=Aurantibacillus circumpalustris TaxID=3036359 RepID=UPI00295BA0D9|nr:hypothetical protein [Aurantibacillus circumpalustris]
MKTYLITTVLFIILIGTKVAAQDAIEEKTYPEKFGNTLNLGIGIGYYGYINQNTPVLHADFEFDVIKNLTVAPSISFYTYENYYYWGGPKNAYRDYRYRQTVIPVGVKVTYYFDELLKASNRWDFYAAGSAGVAIRSTVWESGYYGDTKINHSNSNVYADIHIGAEFHMTKKLGLFLDLSTGVSTFGLAVHL